MAQAFGRWSWGWAGGVVSDPVRSRGRAVTHKGVCRLRDEHLLAVRDAHEVGAPVDGRAVVVARLVNRDRWDPYADPQRPAH